MIPRRIPVLCGALGPAACELKARTRLQAFDPALVYVLHPRELRAFPDGCAVVDLTHVPKPETRAAWALRDQMDERGMVPIPLPDLSRHVRAWHAARKAGAGFTADPGPGDG